MKLLACIRKELTLLVRDRAGLAVLFVMPMALVLVVTLVQSNVLDSRSEVDVLLLNQDSGGLGRAIEEGLQASEFFVVRTSLDGDPLTADSLSDAIRRGRFRLGIVIYPEASRILESGINRLIEGAESEPPARGGIALVLDPAVQSALKDSLESVVQRLIQGEEVRVLLKRLTQLLDLEADATASLRDLPPLSGSGLIAIGEEYASARPLEIKPNAVQHNVPAWTLFGIFFIVMPISGSMIRERNSGTLNRLLTMPVSFPTVLLGKIFSHIVINFGQIVLMLGVGLFVLPWLGTPSLSLGDRPELIGLVGFCASLAATGFGLMLGTLARSHEQASTVGPISIIIAAALGGIMVPVFLMPRILQSVSVASPLRWGHEAFVDVFVRGADLAALMPNLSRLLLFFLATLSVAVLFFFRES